MVRSVRIAVQQTSIGSKASRIGRGFFSATAVPKLYSHGRLTMERSHIPLRKWVLAFYLINASKKGMSAHQLHRMLGISYKSAWFLAHRVREAMKPNNPSPLGGEGKVVEADETEIGGKAKNRAFRKTRAEKAIVLSLVERGWRGSFHVAAVSVTSKTLRPVPGHDRVAQISADDR